MRMVQVSFAKVEVLISFNGIDTELIPIKRGVRQGCPLALYLFLYFGQAFNATAKHQVELGALHDIRLLNNYGQQLLV